MCTTRIANACPAPTRRDGWTPRRQLAFLDLLARTRCVAKAARAVGMSREGAYRLRRRADAALFAAAWDAAMTPRSHRPSRAEIDKGHIRAIARACGAEGAAPKLQPPQRQHRDPGSRGKSSLAGAAGA